jgi:hypothetical protein
MNTHRRTALIVGVLFIAALVPFLIGQALYEPILGSPDYLENAYHDRVIVTIGVLLEFLSAIAVVLIPVLLFPILRIQNLVLALGCVSFRLFEAVLLSVAQVYKLSLVGLSQDYMNRGGLDASYYQIMGNSVQSVIYWVDHAGAIYLVVFVIGALMLNTALYRSRLVPRWLSIWGIIAAVAVLVASVLATFDIALLLAGLLVIPIGLQEQVMALWLIFKGFTIQPHSLPSLHKWTRNINEMTAPSG